MGFVFSLAAVLQVRRNAEEREERILGDVLREMNQTMQSIQRIDAELTGTTVRREAEIEQAFPGSHHHVSYARHALLRQTRSELEEQLTQWKELRDRQVAVHQSARAGREMISDLRVRQRDAYVSAMSRREQSTLDDGYLARRGRS